MRAVEQANQLLDEIRRLEVEIREREVSAAEEMEKVRSRYADVAEKRETVKALDGKLKKLMKKEAAKIFDGRDLVVVEAGRLFHQEEKKVRIPRDAIEQIEKLGWNDGIKIVKSVDRPAVEQWPDDRLILIGAERKPVDVYSYEIVEGK